MMLRRGDYELRPHPRLSDPDAMAARPMPWPFEAGVKWGCEAHAKRMKERNMKKAYMAMWVQKLYNLDSRSLHAEL